MGNYKGKYLSAWDNAIKTYLNVYQPSIILLRPI